MKNPFLLLTFSIFAAGLMSGCDGSKSAPGEASAPVMPKTEGALNAAADETKKAVSEAAATVAQTAKTAASEITSRFVSMAKAQGDTILSSIGQDLSAKANALLDSCGANPSIKTNVQTSLNALVSGKDKEALAPAFQLTQTVDLTDTQMQLAKEVGNLASAFVVQRNFSALSGGQGDVATLVKSLREGQYAATLAPLKNIMNNASLTPTQKDLISSVAEKYAPALKGAAGALQQGLQGLQGLPGVKK